MRLSTANRNSVTVVGRVAETSGQILDRLFAGSNVLKAADTLEAQSLIQRPCDLAKEFSRLSQDALAFVAIGFGPAPSGTYNRELWKGDFDESKHPRVPEGCPEGGEFCSADDSANSETPENPADNIINQNSVMRDLLSKTERKIARALIKNRLMNGLRVIAGLVADVVPYAGEVFDAWEIEEAISDSITTKQDIDAAIEYVRHGPEDLGRLRVDSQDLFFNSPEAFKKDIWGKYYGPAGAGYDYHHIVWKGGANATNIPSGLLNSTENMIRMPRLLHEVITSEYSKPYEETGMSLREWLDTQPYEVQRAKGIEIMRELGIIR